MGAGMGTTARTAAFSIVVGLATAACSVSGFLSADSTTIPVGQPRPAATDRPHRQAQDALDRWAQAVKDNGGVLFMIVERHGSYRKIEVRLAPFPKAQLEKIIAAHLSKFHGMTPAGSGQ